MDERAEDIVWDGEKYVILGDDFTIFTSKNGRDWVKVKNLNYLKEQLGSGINIIIYKLTYGNGKYLLPIGNILFMSTDLINWEGIYEFDIEKIEYDGKEIEIFLHSIEDIFYDGETILITFNSAIFQSNTQVVAIVSSKDLKNWNIWFSDDGTNYERIYKITKDLNKYIVYGNSDKVYISYDGIKWEYEDLSFDLKNINLFNHKKGINISKISYKDGKYYGIVNGFLLLSDDGFNWEIDSMAINAKEFYFNEIYPTNHGMILLADLDGNFYYKEDEYSDYIPIREAGPNTGYNHIVYGNGTYLIVNSSGILYKSNDGLEWEKYIIYVGEPNELIFFSGKFFMFKSGSMKYLYSEDGIKWYEAYLPEIEVDEKYKTYPLFNPLEEPNDFIVKEDEIIVYMYYYPYVWRTTDGINWTTELIRDEVQRPYYGIRYSGGLYIGENYNNKIMVSKDLKNWIPVNNFPIVDSGDIIGFLAGNNKYICIFHTSSHQFGDNRFIGKYALSYNGVD